MQNPDLVRRFPRQLPLVLAISAALALVACGGSSNDNTSNSVQADVALVVPSAPADLGFVDTAPVLASVPAFVDNVASNQRGDARYATLDTNAGVRVLAGFKTIWQPLTDIVDAGVSAPAVGNFPAVIPSVWTGLPNDGTAGGTILNSAVHNANIQYVVTATTARTPAQELAAYLDDRRGKGYSVSDGMGPLTTAWRAAAQQTTSVTAIAADATTVLYNDTGNNIGVGGSANAAFGSVVDFISAMSNNGSTEPAKRFYKYARPYRWSSNVVVVPALVPAKSSTPTTDGGFTSGHSAEATRDTVAMAYAVPERFQEILTRGLELGENRILAGMHSPLDVISGRMQGQAVVAANLVDPANATKKAAAVAQAHATLMAQTSTSSDTFNAFAHSATVATDRFADYATNKANYLRRMTYSFAPIAATTAPAVVPKGAEALLETRLPYLSDVQRRVVLKTTALASGYPVMDDAEGWGRLNLFAAADGYGVFTGNVVVVMDANQGGFSAMDSWRNDISGAGKLLKQGSGTLKLTGNNSWTGGTELNAGVLEADSVSALGKGDVYVSGGTLVSNATGATTVSGKYTQLANTTLELDLGSGQQGRFTATGVITIAGGTLRIKFQNGYKPAVGDTLNIITAASFKGKFTSIVVDGFSATPIYTDTGLQLRLGA
ncbi:phosphatase PAP2 family protein [Undibacterium sp. 5I1]|uniref:phosphatase PAP2 family protein n=2 Tax=unclassified Undibacterium TaxID=2630295 RepID=UPI002AB5D59C|nr:phosphatase PAP2 family protein [Undibacterium sp. 5I1]MDY7539835.1 phosphatase PAP2 family protein [Undibacterium sp. 5I1]MEB0256871.1 phosphatase PAP2 family protein [Undibacterium sp. 5I1]